MKKKIGISLGALMCTTVVMGSAIACGKNNSGDYNIKPLPSIDFDMSILVDIGDALKEAKKAAKNNPVVKIKENQFSEQETTIFDTKNPNYINPLSKFLENVANQLIGELNYFDDTLALMPIKYKTIDALSTILFKKMKNSEGHSVLDILSGGQSQMLAGFNDFIKSFKGIESIETAAGPDIVNIASLILYVGAIDILKGKNIELNIDYNGESLISLAVVHGELNQGYLDHIYYIDKDVDPTSLFIDDMADIGAVISDGVNLVRTMVDGKGGLVKKENAFPLSDKMISSFSSKLHMSKKLIRNIQSILREFYDMYSTN
ncbi:MAG: hypothetical protein HRT98_00235 [Mycoplasmatales bacterium]|nr:hypothetical protein [Mycoplasmatales bacterium]